MKYRNLSELPELTPCPTGSPMRSTYHLVEPDGDAPYLEKDGEVDQYAQIQTYAPECDMSTLVLRYANGDINAFDQRQGVYADISGLPDTLAGFDDYVDDLADQLHHLYDAFGGEYASYDEFATAVLSGDFKSGVNIDNSESEVKENEQE